MSVSAPARSNTSADSNTCAGGQTELCETRRTAEEAGWRRVVRNFTPSWFAATMGTGIVSILLHELPYNAYWIQVLSWVFFALNVVLFATFSFICIVRFSLYPEIWSVMIMHPVQSLFLGTFPMGLSTIINMMTYADLHLPSMHFHKPGLHTITGGIMLPIVPTIVVSSTGALVSSILPSASHAQLTILTSYVLWGLGVSFSMVITALYFHRLTVHSLPSRELIVSVFLPVGPLGQGGFGIQRLGREALRVFPQTGLLHDVLSDGSTDGSLIAGRFFYLAGLLMGLIMWGFGLLVLSNALLSIALTKKFPFNMGWWGFTFPIGVLATCTGQLAKSLDSTFMRMVTMVLSLAVVALWTVVAIKTLWLAYTGEIFYAPCLKDLRNKQDRGEESKTR
ncbi:Plasma membrane sulfite pump involved in sulfite metabolism [Ceratocystis pirilliformis]|uniref:Plasma membrane sulfite pump involved in sulfite metabolism n=1 Tax=Ceratocystis pirilliformis TaxID=259994 RepID=A0ABR3ZM59_9PEZI